jgi:fructose-1,6-bisphosphatase I
VIANAVTVSGMQSLHSLHGEANTTGDDQKTLDILSNEVMINVLQRTCKVGVMVSEENPDVITCTPPASPPGGGDGDSGGGGGSTYAVVFDPLDGSSNIECSVSTGTIFGVYKCKDAAAPGVDDALQQGRNLVCAGYVLYSSSTVMVLSLGLDDGVRSFTLDPTFGEFVETASPVAIPAKPKRIISVNAGNSEIWNLPTSEFVRWTKRQKDRYSLRYIGSMVADVHRTLLYGGIFMYPADFFNRSRQAPAPVRVLPHGVPRRGGGRHGVNGHAAHPRRRAHGHPPAVPDLPRVQARRHQG